MAEAEKSHCSECGHRGVINWRQNIINISHLKVQSQTVCFFQLIISSYLNSLGSKMPRRTTVSVFSDYFPPELVHKHKQVTIVY